MFINKFSLPRAVPMLIIIGMAITLAACGGGGGGGGGTNPVNPPVQADVISTYNVNLDAASVVAGSTAAGSASATLQHNETQGQIDVQVTLTGISADAVSLRRGFAGDTSDVAFALQAGSSADTWELNGQSFAAADASDLKDGRFYLQVSTMAEPDGALRGQILPQGFEIVTTDLSGGAVVLSKSGAVANSAKGTITGRMWTTLTGNSLTAFANVQGIANANAIELRRAPAGQNGPLITSFEPAANAANRWQLQDFPVDATLQANLDNRTLYVSVPTNAAPNGVARGQVETAASTAPADASAFVVTMTDPANADKLDGLPDMVFITLNREPLAASVTTQAVDIAASGGDGSFGDGNEVPVTPATVMANGNTIEISLAGAASTDDVYRVMIDDSIVDTAGIALDGGTFQAAFEVQRPAIKATLTQIQNEIFTPSCATSGCHSGSNPPDGLHLTAGDSYSNIVNVNAVQSDLDRIEPGDPDSSYLYRKLLGTGIVANRMPLGAPRLPQEQIDLVKQWILDGAEDN